MAARFFLHIGHQRFDPAEELEAEGIAAEELCRGLVFEETLDVI